MKVHLYVARYGLPILLMICVLVGAIAHAATTRLKVGIYNNPPTVFLDEKGTPQGVYVDTLNAIAEKENWTLDYVFGQWEDLLGKVKMGDIDLLTAIAHSPERATWLDFNREAFAERWGVVYAPEGAPVRTMADLAGKRMALPKQDIHASFFKQAADMRGLEMTLFEVAGYEAVFEALKNHNADAGLVSNGYGVSNAGRYGLLPTPLTFKPTQLMVAFPKGQHYLIAETLDVYLKQWKNEPGSVYLASYQRWLGPARGQDRPWSLTLEQRSWLAKHKTVRVAYDGHFPPYSYLNDEGQIEGLAVDLLHLLADRLGIRLDIYPTYIWKDLFEAATQVEVDVVATMVHRPEREKWFVFTRPYVHKSLVVMTRADNNDIHNREDIAGKRIALVRGYQYVPRIIQDFPTLKPTYVDTMLDGLNAVATHNADGAIIFFGAGRHLQMKYGIANVKFGAIYDRNSSLDSIAVRKDWPELATILDKALLALKDTELQNLYRKWNTDEVLLPELQSDRLSARQKAWLLSLAVLLGLILFAFMAVIVWNRTLRRNVGIKTQELEKELGERFKAEAEIRRGRKEWETTFDAMSDWVCVIDSDKRILRSNAAGKDIVDLSANDILGQNCCDLIHGIGESLPTCPVDKMRETRQSETCEYFDSKLNKWINITVEPVFDEGGHISRAVHIIQDISEKKEIETKLIQAQKMESIGTLAGGIAHDFNNILAIIIGNAELSNENIPAGNPAKRNLKEIQSASLRAKDLVQHILRFTRKAATDRIPIKIYPIIEDTLKMLRASIPTDIEIRQNMSYDSDIILADPTQISQVLMNLCTNAAHAMRDEGGVLEISLRNVEFEKHNVKLDLRPGRYVKLAVGDTGHGIDPEHFDRIFDPYFTTKGLGEGTGMGLSVVHGIVKTHDGAVAVKSNPEKETVFDVLFPVVEGVMETEADEINALPTGNEKILFIDDEEAIKNLVKKRLEMQGYQVEAKNNPVDALELFRSKPERFDLIITDMTMPNMTGDKLAKEILNIRPDVPIILCSGYSHRIDAEKAAALGIRKYMEKPLDMSDFVTSIRKVLDAAKNSDA